jgi:hypothetical protein
LWLFQLAESVATPVDYQQQKKKWNNLNSEAMKETSAQIADLCKTGRGGPTATLDDETTKILSAFLDDTELPSVSDSESSLVSNVPMKYDTFLGTIIRRDVS